MDRNASRLLRAGALTLGALYVLAGGVGFLITGLEGFAAADRDAYLLVFEVNPLHNAVHVAIGVALLAGGLQHAAASRAVLILVGGVYAILGAVGFPLLDSELNLLSLNEADNWLHIGTAGVAFLVVVVAGIVRRLRHVTSAR